jgi:hypothetical protein
MVTVRGHAFCWDVIGDSSFAARAADVGVDSVTLAASYHCVRAATPWHPDHQLVDARYAALYRPVRPQLWRHRRLRPLAPDWMSSTDPYREAATALHANGLPVTAWVVLAHNTRLGTRFGDVTVVNCFGEPYPYALCPAWPEVRDYAATLAAEAIRDAPADGVSLESCGQMGIVHIGHHDKTDGAWSPAGTRWLSVCCCLACQSAWHERGLDPKAVITAMRAAVRTDGDGPDPEVGAALLAARHDAADALRTQVVASLREVSPGIAVTLHAQPDPWATGPSPGLTAKAARDVDALLVPAWPIGTSSGRAVAGALASGLPVNAYVTALPPVEPPALDDHIRAMVRSGATGISVYHLGLLARRRLSALRTLIGMARTLELPS